MIVLTAEEAEKVRGLSPSKVGHGLAPVPLKDGRFMLGEEALDDPAHDDVRDFLASLPREPLEKLPVYTEADYERGEIVVESSLRLTVRAADTTTPKASASLSDVRAK